MVVSIDDSGVCCVLDVGCERFQSREPGSECSDAGAGRLCYGHGRRTVTDVGFDDRRPCTQPPHTQQVRHCYPIVTCKAPSHSQQVRHCYPIVMYKAPSHLQQVLTDCYSAVTEL